MLITEKLVYGRGINATEISLYIQIKKGAIY